VSMALAKRTGSSVRERIGCRARPSQEIPHSASCTWPAICLPTKDRAGDQSSIDVWTVVQIAGGDPWRDRATQVCGKAFLSGQWLTEEVPEETLAEVE